MACTNCSSGSKGTTTPKGCKSNGSCNTGSCNKLTVFDWLSNMSLPQGQEVFNCVEVRFKNGRKDFFKNTEKIPLAMGDIVATETSPGHDIGIVSLTGELVKVQMKRKKVNLSVNLPKIYRKATQKDISIWSTSKAKEETVRMRARELAIALNLEMKISDVEFQGDGSKAIFYYTANERVDFRQLIKDFARAFNTRIEMKQVGFRQEAARLGGIGSCGRELCCSTWLTDFRSVSTSAARYQQLSLNPQKLAGQCGKLKCCLNYELDTYLDALQDFPKTDTKLVTEKGTAACQKIDIFKGLMWFSYEKQAVQWQILTTKQVKEIINLNKEGKKIESLEEYADVLKAKIDDTQLFKNAVGQDDLTRFDQPKRRNKRRSNKKQTARKTNNRNTPNKQNKNTKTTSENTKNKKRYYRKSNQKKTNDTSKK